MLSFKWFILNILIVSVLTQDDPVINADFDNYKILRIGERLTLICKTNITSNNANVEWEQKSGLDPNRVNIVDNGTESILEIFKARYSDIGTYSCNKYENNISTTAQITVIVSPLVSMVSNIEIPAGHTLILICNITAFPEYKVNWYFGEFQLEDNERDISIQPTRKGSQLKVLNIKKQSSGKFKCIANNLAGNSSNETNVIVHDKPDVELPKKLEFIKGNNYTEICKVKNEENIEKIIKWQKDGQNIDLKLHNVQFQNVSGFINSVIKFINIDLNHEGKYTCFATNKAGIGNDTMEIKVLDLGSESSTGQNNTTKYSIINKPEVTMNDEKVELLIGDALNLRCNIKNFVPVKILWKFEGKLGGKVMDDNSIKTYHYYGKNSNETLSELLITHINEANIGNFTCIVVDKDNEIRQKMTRVRIKTAAANDCLILGVVLGGLLICSISALVYISNKRSNRQFGQTVNLSSTQGL